MRLPPYLSIVIPAYNEASRLPDTLRQVVDYCKSLEKPCEILVVDDGSTDATSAAAKQFSAGDPRLRVISYGVNRGKGYAVRNGVLESQGEFVLFMDADSSTSIREFDNFSPLLQDGIPVVVASRRAQASRVLKHQPGWREWMGNCFTRITNRILGLHVSDFTCGFKAFRQLEARTLFERQRVRRWAFDPEILYLANRFGYRIVEVPVQWSNSPETKVRIFRDTLVSFLSLLFIRWNAWTGKYDMPITKEEA